MSFNQTSFTKRASLSFTISQEAPGALLKFEPPLHSKELAEAIHNYIPGPFTLQEKQRQISSDFCFWRSQACPDGPASYLYDASPALEFSSFSTESSFNDQSPPSLSKEASTSGSQSSRKAPARRNRATKAVKTTAKTISSGPRLPGLSIMTKDGIDITDAGPRGPKTKEQREHAALMRKLQACPTCRKRKQRCNPSHHTQNSVSSCSAATPSSRRSSAVESKASTPASSAGSENSPIRPSQEMQISQTGQHFNGTIPPPKSALTPSDFASFDDSLDISFNLDAADLDVFDSSIFDQSLLSTGFEATTDESFVDSVFDFNSWDDYQNVSHASNFSSDGVLSQRHDRVLADSSQSLVTASSSPGSNTAGQFVDFVPAWDFGSTPYVPVNGSRLQSPDEFGLHPDFSQVVSTNAQVHDQIGSRPNTAHQSREFDLQMDSLFEDGGYSSSNFSTPAIFTPTSMSTSSSSQGQSVSTSGSPYAVTQHTPLDSVTSPRSSTVTRNTIAPTPDEAVSTWDSLQPQSFTPTHRHLQVASSPGPLESYSMPLQHAAGNDVLHDSFRHQELGPVHTRPQSEIAIIGMAGRFPNAANHEAFWTQLENGLDVRREMPPDRFSSQSVASNVSSAPANDLGPLQPTNPALDGVSLGGSEQRRMAPAIQNSWGTYLQRQPDTHGSFVLDNQGQEGTTSLVNPARDYQAQLKDLERQAMMARHEPSYVNTQRYSPDVKPHEQSSSPDVIPRRSSRPFRLSQVAFPSSVTEAQEVTLQLTSTHSGVQLHTPPNPSLKFFCDYPRCLRATEPLGRKDHYRDHLRETHGEDLVKRAKGRRLLDTSHAVAANLPSLHTDGGMLGTAVHRFVPVANIVCGMGEPIRVFVNNFSAAGGNTAFLVEDAPLEHKPLDKAAGPRSHHLIATSANNDRNAMGTEVYQQVAAVRSQTLSTLSSTSNVVVKQQQKPQRDLSSNTTLERFLGVVLCTGLAIFASQSSLCPISVLVCLLSLFSCRLNGTTKAGTSSKYFESINDFRSALTHLASNQHLSIGTVVPRRPSGHWLRAIPPTQVLV